MCLHTTGHRRPHETLVDIVNNSSDDAATLSNQVNLPKLVCDHIIGSGSESVGAPQNAGGVTLNVRQLQTW